MKIVDFNHLNTTLNKTDPVRLCGKVTSMTGLIIEGSGPHVSIGSLCQIHPIGELPPINAEVVGFKNNRIILMPLDNSIGVGPGSAIYMVEKSANVKVSESFLGRVIDGRGKPLDGKPEINEGVDCPIYADPVNPLNRRLIDTHLDLGIKAINGLLTCGKGQRVGIMAGTGVGKSVLLGMIARNTNADINVIALIGERGREVKEFIEKNLGDEGLRRSVIIAATSDQSPLIRMRGAYIATAIAEYFRNQGNDVLLMMDSLTRFSMAQREIGLAIGEPPTTKGYTPSVFSLLPKLLERAGTAKENGSITGLYTVLVEGDDLTDPISDSARAILDGHIVLSRDLAAHNHYPAINILESISRVMIDIVDKDHMKESNTIKELIATYKESEDLINLGAYVKGSNPKIDRAISLIDKINTYLCQGIDEKVDFKLSISELFKINNTQ